MMIVPACLELSKSLVDSWNDIEVDTISLVKYVVMFKVIKEKMV